MQRDRHDGLWQRRTTVQHRGVQFLSQDLAAGQAPGKLEPEHQLVDREAVSERRNGAIPRRWFMKAGTANPVADRGHGQTAVLACTLQARQVRAAGPAEIRIHADPPAKQAMPWKQGIQDPVRAGSSGFMYLPDHDVHPGDARKIQGAIHAAIGSFTWRLKEILPDPSRLAPRAGNCTIDRSPCSRPGNT